MFLIAQLLYHSLVSLSSLSPPPSLFPSPLLPLSLLSLFPLPLPQYGDLVEHLCRCSFLEIYNEQVFDLLDAASSGLNLRENIKRGVYVDGLTEHSVSSARDAYEVGQSSPLRCWEQRVPTTVHTCRL